MDALYDEDFERVRSALGELHPAEIADLLESLPLEPRERIWEQLAPERYAEVLAEVESGVRTARLEQMQPVEVAAVASDVDPDDAADMLQDLPEPFIEEVLQALDAQNRQRIEQVLQYDEDTAGGLMNTDVITIRPDVTLGTVVRYLRWRGEIPVLTNRLMVVDRENRLVGVLRLALLLIADEDSKVEDHMELFPGLNARAPVSDVVTVFEQRDFISAPVVDDEGKLLGRITIDDVVDQIEKQAERSMMHMAGLEEGRDLFESVISTARRRTPWLGVNLATALLASWVIGLFEATLQQVVALAILMPVVASMGGIAGSQTLTVVTRGLALGQVGSNNARDLLMKELRVGIVSSVIWALVVALVAGLWFADPAIGLVGGCAIIVNLVVAAVAGAIIPLSLKQLGVDPALAGGVLLTTVTDVIGFMAFLGLGTVLLLPA
ncbi:MAG: magnesium transporter [Gammaproteobacteria bacterium]|nr:magnesium transporter [Gammaproteobacteria bacterium]